jgi:hypothetical protein
MPIGALEEPGARGEFKEWRDGMVDNPRKADYAWTVLARIFSVAKDRDASASIPVSAAADCMRAVTAWRRSGAKAPSSK